MLDFHDSAVAGVTRYCGERQAFIRRCLPLAYMLALQPASAPQPVRNHVFPAPRAGYHAASCHHYGAVPPPATARGYSVGDADSGPCTTGESQARERRVCLCHEENGLQAAEANADTVVPAGLSPAQVSHMTRTKRVPPRLMSLQANIILQHTIDAYLGQAQKQMGQEVDQQLQQAAQRIQGASSPAPPP